MKRAINPVTQQVLQAAFWLLLWVESHICSSSTTVKYSIRHRNYNLSTSLIRNLPWKLFNW
jgi:hypothetical protein